LLVVVAIIGILSAVGVVSYSGYKASAEKKQAEITLNTIYLAQQEYKSNNGEYCIATCTNNAQIIANLFDKVDDLTSQAYTFKVTSASTMSIIATNKAKTACTITITQTNKTPSTSGC
jgi:type II secretory pathway pseudopilin PulG